MIKYSVLDLATVVQGDQPSDTFKKSADLAREVEQLGYTRFWLAEHHNVANVASSATAVLIGHIAGVTNRIQVGSGGHHVAKPCSLDRSRTIRYIEFTLSRPHRPRCGTGARHGSIDNAGHPR
ncbi:LLM class flavin-dependent oxidoreductase [Sphingobacterium sp. R2]|uniref:LLM class flavin-dependent oxidoreductase n=1 Tax=Sphingobacterium sp. R2 TaxID=3112958 RepID=UPI00345DB8A0